MGDAPPGQNSQDRQAPNEFRRTLEISDLASKCFPSSSTPHDALSKLLQETKLFHATEHMRQLMLKDARIPGGPFLLDSTSDGCKLAQPGEYLSRILTVTRLDDMRLLNGHTQIDATVKLSRHCELSFSFRRAPRQHGTSLPLPSWMWEEDEEDEEEEMDASTKRRRRPPVAPLRATTMVEYTIYGSYLITKGLHNPGVMSPRTKLLEVIIQGFHPSGTPSPAGVMGLADMPDEEPPDEEDPDSVKDICFALLGDEEEFNNVMMAALMTCSEPMTVPEFLIFLMLFPYHEEEWDVANTALDRVLEGFEDEEDEEDEEDFRPRSPPKEPKKRKNNEPPTGPKMKKGKKAKK